MAEESVSRATRFGELLSASGLTLTELADRLGKKPASVARWGDKVPDYALAYLELWVEAKESERTLRECGLWDTRPMTAEELAAVNKPRETDWQLVEKVLPDGEKLVE